MLVRERLLQALACRFSNEYYELVIYHKLLLKMANLKREYNVPLRRKVKTAPMWRRSKKAISVLKNFMIHHMNAENVIICSELNELFWARGGKCPPGKISVVALRTQVNGVESTIVNLLSVGVDAQMAKYGTVATEESAVEVKTETKAKVADAEVKEVKAEKKTVKSEKKADTKKEVKEE